MATETVNKILAELASVDTERRLRAADAALARRVHALKAYQQRRFAHTYADLLATPRYERAARFFLDELYGPSDFTRRDAQFARVVPALVRLFPREIVRMVAALTRLHSLSEALDTDMARCLPANNDGRIDAEQYLAAWQATGRAGDRDEQIVLTLEIASTLDSVTQKTLVRNSLRLMRGPAQAAGLSDLQGFLENGLNAFRSMNGAAEFTRIVDEREHRLARSLYQAKETSAIAALLPNSFVGGAIQ